MVITRRQKLVQQTSNCCIFISAISDSKRSIFVDSWATLLVSSSDRLQRTAVQIQLCENKRNLGHEQNLRFGAVGPCLQPLTLHRAQLGHLLQIRLKHIAVGLHPTRKNDLLTDLIYKKYSYISKRTTTKRFICGWFQIPSIIKVDYQTTIIPFIFVAFLHSSTLCFRQFGLHFIKLAFKVLGSVFELLTLLLQSLRCHSYSKKSNICSILTRRKVDQTEIDRSATNLWYFRERYIAPACY